MIAIPFQVSDTHYSVVLVLQDDNIERIKSCDPAVFESGKVLVEPFKSLKLCVQGGHHQASIGRRGLPSDNEDTLPWMEPSA